MPPQEILLPTTDEAEAFVLMIMAGLPSGVAMTYFHEGPEAQALHDRWVRSKEVQRATKKMQGGKDWQHMSSAERIQTALDKNYNEMAYFLYAQNYSDMSPGDKNRADICRQALETKIAGMAGRIDPLAQFWADVKAGRVVVPAFGAQKAS